MHENVEHHLVKSQADHISTDGFEHTLLLRIIYDEKEVVLRRESYYEDPCAYTMAHQAEKILVSISTESMQTHSATKKLTYFDADESTDYGLRVGRTTKDCNSGCIQIDGLFELDVPNVYTVHRYELDASPAFSSSLSSIGIALTC